jgi:hypothetical protein
MFIKRRIKNSGQTLSVPFDFLWMNGKTLVRFQKVLPSAIIDTERVYLGESKLSPG